MDKVHYYGAIMMDAQEYRSIVKVDEMYRAYHITRGYNDEWIEDCTFLDALFDVTNYTELSQEEAEAIIERWRKAGDRSIMVVQAAIIAGKAHEGQLDKAGMPYISHCQAVARQMETDEEKAVAWLHDVLEDTDWTLDDLKATGEFTENVLKAVKAMTHRQEVPYMDYVDDLKHDPIARRVKIADIKHNMDVSRLKDITEQDITRLHQYLDALASLLAQKDSQ